MALCVWFSRLDQVSGRTWKMPRAVILSGVGAPSFYALIGRDGVSACAFGISSLTSQQIVDLNADAAVWAREFPSGWRTLTVADLPLAIRNKLSAALTNQGLNPGIVGTDTLPQAFQKILDSLPGTSNPQLSDWRASFVDQALIAEPF